MLKKSASVIFVLIALITIPYYKIMLSQNNESTRNIKIL